jgi:hypothetical protein
LKEGRFGVGREMNEGEGGGEVVWEGVGKE